MRTLAAEVRAVQLRAAVAGQLLGTAELEGGVRQRPAPAPAEGVGQRVAGQPGPWEPRLGRPGPEAGVELGVVERHGRVRVGRRGQGTRGGLLGLGSLGQGGHVSLIVVIIILQHGKVILQSQNRDRCADRYLDVAVVGLVDLSGARLGGLCSVSPGPTWKLSFKAGQVNQGTAELLLLLLAGANDQVLQNCFRLLAVAGGGGGGGWCTRLASVAKWKPGQGSASPPPPHFVKGCIRSAQLPQSPGRWAAGTRSHPALIITHQPTTSTTFRGGVADRAGNEPS